MSAPSRTGHRCARLLAALALAATLGSAGSGVAAESPFVAFDLAIGNASFGGTATPEISFTITVNGADGSVKARATVNVEPDGDWTSPAGVIGNIAVGDRFRARAAGTILGELVIPTLTIRTDRATDQVSGRAPAGDAVEVTFLDCPAPTVLDADCTSGALATRTANGRGRWSLDASAADPRGGDRVRLAWTRGADRVLVSSIVPYLLVVPGSSRLEGYLYAGGRTSVTLSRGGSVIARADARGYGSFGVLYATFRNASDRAVKVRTGDVVRAPFAADASLTVAAIQANLAAASTSVDGTCLPDGSGVVGWQEPLRSARSTFSANGAGAWATTFALAPDAGASWSLECGSAAGDVLRTTGTVGP